MFTEIIDICFPVSITRMGHSDTRGKESYQQYAHSESSKTHQCTRGTKTPLDLCKCFLVYVIL